MARYNELGEEILDPTPVSIPIGFGRPLPLADKIRLMTREAMSQAARELGEETFEEADDFNVGEEDLDPHAKWEDTFDPEGVGAREDEIKHGVTSPMDETKIERGEAEYARLIAENEKLKAFQANRPEYRPEKAAGDPPLVAEQ